MKKLIAFILAASMLLALAGCVETQADPTTTGSTPDPTQGTVVDTQPVAPQSFLWDNFDDRDPNAKPDTAPNGANIWWDNWANLRAKNEDGAIKLDMRPKEYDPEDYETKEEYYAAAADWMANWGEAIDMWSLDGISWCKYLTIKIKGEVGGEESSLIMDWHPEDAKFYSARFSDLVLADGSHPVITTEWQTLTIDLEASGFPGMTNALHIRAFEACVIWIDEIVFTEPISAIDATSSETIQAGMTAPETGKPAELPIQQYLEEGNLFLWDNFDDRDPNNKPEYAPNGANIWWDNWANLRAKNEDGAIKLDMRPKAYNEEDYDSLEDYYAHAADWMANWGEAIDMWALDGISWCKYLTIKVKGEVGGEEAKLIMDWHPEDSKFYSARFSDLVLADGSHPVITTEWQEITIDLEASGFPGMTNALHIRAFADCVIWIDEIYFSEAVEAIDTTNVVAGLTAEETGKPGDLPIQQYIADLG